jgi:glycosyltransferase involved in cell wall biosynthesis
MIADMHRARHLAWELPGMGWEVEILAPNAEFQRSHCVDAATNVFFNPAVVCHEVAPSDLPLFRRLHVRSIGWRALWPLYRAGASLLSRKKFDIIYISTGNFVLFLLGRLWLDKFHVPYVLDYHDPWVRLRREHITTRHAWKLKINSWLSPKLERFAIGKAAGLVAVSPVYVEELRARYGKLNCFRSGCNKAIPFAGSERDFAGQSKLRAVGDTARTRREIAYVGAGGSIMARSFENICRALAALRQSDPSWIDPIRIRLYGTFAFWKEGDPKPLEELAQRYGLGDVVEEIPPWIGYRSALEKIQEADGLLVLGVDDQGYVPSKLFNYALTKKPLLASFRADSPAGQFFREIPNLGHLITFTPEEQQAAMTTIAITKLFLIEVRQRAVIERGKEITDYLAPAMARRHVELFEMCLKPNA